MIDTKQFISEIKEVFKVKQVYEARWVWYHTIMAVELLIIIFLLTGILIKI
tara:strand:+ start:52 stop:204 length:153 start_codon:yes stop_codon:yes gene_type:complete